MSIENGLALTLAAIVLLVGWRIGLRVQRRRRELLERLDPETVNAPLLAAIGSGIALALLGVLLALRAAGL